MAVRQGESRFKQCVRGDARLPRNANGHTGQSETGAAASEARRGKWFGVAMSCERPTFNATNRFSLTRGNEEALANSSGNAAMGHAKAVHGYRKAKWAGHAGRHGMMDLAISGKLAPCWALYARGDVYGKSASSASLHRGG